LMNHVKSNKVELAIIHLSSSQIFYIVGFVSPLDDSA
jgi:hypothetical protein